MVLTGEGSDEILAGYERYPQTLANLLVGRWLPDAGRRALVPLIDRLPNTSAAKRKAGAVVPTGRLIPSYPNPQENTN